MKINLLNKNSLWKEELAAGFKTKRLVVRPFNTTDFLWLAEISSSKEIYKFLPDLENKADILDWFKSVYTKANFLFHTILIKKNSNTAGFLMFNMCPDKKLRIGAWLAENLWNKGYVTEVLLGLISRLSHSEFNHSLYADIHNDNHGAKKALLKSGFTQTGCIGQPSKKINEYVFHNKFHKK